MCPRESHCLELEDRPGYSEIVGKLPRVRFAGVEQIYDPENYRLTLAQQDIGPGSHLRLLLEPNSDRGVREFRAIIVWIGDRFELIGISPNPHMQAGVAPLHRQHNQF